MKTACDRCI